MSVNKKMPEATRLWIEALRSGNYNQSKGCLRDDNGFCCLGVAANILTKDPWLKNKNDHGQYILRESGNESGVLPDSRYARMVTSYAYNRDFATDQTSLAELNDAHGFTFPMIADVIESWWSDNPLNPDDYEHRNIVRRKHGKDAEIES